MNMLSHGREGNDHNKCGQTGLQALAPQASRAALLALSLSVSCFSGAMAAAGIHYGGEWSLPTQVARPWPLHPRDFGGYDLNEKLCGSDFRLSRGSDAHGHARVPSSTWPPSPDPPCSSERRSGQGYEGQRTPPRCKDFDRSKRRSPEPEKRLGPLGYSAACGDDRERHGGSTTEPPEAGRVRPVCQTALSSSWDGCLGVDYALRELYDLASIVEAYGADLSSELLNAWFASVSRPNAKSRPAKLHECFTAGNSRRICMRNSFTTWACASMDDRYQAMFAQVLTHVMNMQAATTAAVPDAEMEEPPGRYEQRMGDGGRDTATANGPSPASSRMPGAERNLKSGHRQLVSQAWDRHRRDQVAISCTATKLRDVMTAEYYTTMNKGAREAFVMEIPMLCTEIYSDIEPVSTAARRRGHSTGSSTLTLNTGWDFRLRSHRLRALDIVRWDEPYFLVIAFPCGPWSPLQNLSTPRDRLQQLRAAARPLVNFAARLAREQLEGGRHFVIENPFGSAAWKLPSLRLLRRHPLCRQVVVDMCRFGLRGPAGLLHKKPTRLLTSSQAVLSKMLNKRCTGLHQHEPVMGGSKVTTAAGHYTKEFSRALVEAFEEEFDFESYIPGGPPRVRERVLRGCGLPRGRGLHP